MLFSASDAESVDSASVAAARRALDAHGRWLDVLLVGNEASRLPDGATLVDDPESVLRKRYGGDVARLYLIRPDGYVAYRSRSVDGLDAYLQRVLKE